MAANCADGSVPSWANYTQHKIVSKLRNNMCVERSIVMTLVWYRASLSQVIMALDTYDGGAHGSVSCLPGASSPTTHSGITSVESRHARIETPRVSSNPLIH